MTPTETTPKTWNYNTLIGGDAELLPGEVCETAREVFLYGHCHNLAAAILELRPHWRPAGCWENGELGHVAVEIEEGLYFDVRGRVCEDELLEEFVSYDAFVELLDWDDLEWLVDTGQYRPWRVKDAIPFAAALLEDEGL